MNNLQAGQHIYANVEQAQSPQKRGGFQTLFYTTSALSKIEVEDIETRLLYFLSENEPIARLFFTTSTGKSVLAQIIPLAEPDRFGRRGRYLAHSLVFTPETFAELGADPFAIFRDFPFIKNVEQALQIGNFQTGDIPAIPFDGLVATRHNIEEAKKWPLAELKKLSLLALQADQLARDQFAIAFLGEPQLVENALEIVFLALPKPLRQYCTFDTYFHGCRLKTAYYWAVGLLERPTDQHFIVVDLQTKHVTNTVSNYPETAYQHWILAQLEANNLELITKYKEFVFDLCQWLDNPTFVASLLDSAPEEAIISAFQVNDQKVKASLKKSINEKLPPPLSNRIFEQIYHQANTLEHFKFLRHGFELPQLLEKLFESYKDDDFRLPHPDEIETLGLLLQQISHRDLNLLYTCWTSQEEKLHLELGRLSDEEYREFVQTALHFRFVDLFLLVVPPRAEAFLDLYLASDAFREQDLVALVQTLLKNRRSDGLSRLVVFIPNRTLKELRALAKLISQNPNIPSAFQNVVLGGLIDFYRASNFSSPPTDELKVLRTIVQQYYYRDLNLLYACWTSQEEKLHLELGRLSDDEYREFVQTALHFRFVDLFLLVVPPRAEAFLDLYLASDAFREQDLVALVKVLLKIGKGDCLSQLVPFVPSQSSQALETLAKLIGPRFNIPEIFRKVVNETLASLPPEKKPFNPFNLLLGKGGENRRDR